MPTFRLNKLIRDKLRDEYVRMNQQATFKDLSPEAFHQALKQKILEETEEISLNASTDSIASELADIQQALLDLMKTKRISSEEVESLRLAKYEKKGGFEEATFIETLTLEDNDEWVAYYRAEPDRFKEL